jgi:starch synthase
MLHKEEIAVPVSWRNQYCGIKQLEHEGITHYFLDNEFYFKRDGFYGYFDDAERFTFFCRAVLEALPHYGFIPDIIHCHDWQTALVPLFLKEFYNENISAKTVFTIHNLKFQGTFTHWILHNILGLGDHYFTSDKLEYNGEVNLLKAGIVYCDRLTTVSKTYANEIMYPFYGEGLDGLIRAYEYKMKGILNGVDYNEYNPETDPYIYVKYKNEIEKKRLNKTKLQEEFDLPLKSNIPLLGIVSRLTSQKGLDLLIHILDELLHEELQLVIVGTGDREYEQALVQAANHHTKKLRVVLKFDEGLARKVYAAADIFLMPSLYEPCGLGQIIALRYGALPLVRETGGLKDTIVSYNEINGEGNGFSFTNYNAHDFLYTIRRAHKLYKKKKIWTRIMEDAFNSNYSWDSSAQEYLKLYRELT